MVRDRSTPFAFDLRGCRLGALELLLGGGAGQEVECGVGGMRRCCVSGSVTAAWLRGVGVFLRLPSSGGCMEGRGGWLGGVQGRGLAESRRCALPRSRFVISGGGPFVVQVMTICCSHGRSRLQGHGTGFFCVFR